MAKEYTFNTFIEAGDFLKHRYPQDENLAQLDVESAGIKWAEAEPDAVEVIEAERQSSPRATFPYQPAEGFNPLKALGNVPYSGLKLASDIGQALASPIDTGVGLARGAAGALESGLLPDAYTMEEGEKKPYSISPENVETWRGIKEGFKESVSPRGLQERPLDAWSNVLTGTGLLAKLGKVGARGASAAAKGQVPERLAGVSEKAVEAGQRIADFTGRADPGQRVTRALDKTGDIMETVEKATQRYDPANIMTRGGIEAAKYTGRKLGEGVVATGRAGARYVKGKAQETKAYQTGKKAVDQINEFLEGGKIDEWVRNQRTQADDVGYTALAKLQNLRKKAGDVGEFVLGEEARATANLGGVLGGLLEETLGFTFGLGSKLVRELRDISMKGDEQAALTLETIRHADDATVHKRLAGDLRGAVKQYSENQSEIHRQMREPLQLNRVVVDINPIRQQILDNLPSDVQPLADGNVQFSPFFSETGQAKLRSAIESIMAYDKNAISLQQLDNFKGLIDELLYEGGLPPESRSASALRNMRGATSAHIKQIADDPVAMNAQIRSLREKDIARALPGMTSPPPGSIGEAIPPELLEAFADDAIVDMFGRAAEVGAGEYSAAMRQYFDFQDNMDNLRNNLGLERPQTRTFATGDVDPATGRPVTEEVLRQKKSDIEMLRSVFQAFDDDTGIALETLKNLAKETNRPELISQTVGALFRPTFGGGLIVRSEISQAGRDFGRIATAGTVNAVTGLLELPLSLAAFSPKYGGQIFAAAMSPEGRKFLAGTYAKGKRYGNQSFDFIKTNAPDYYRRVRQRVADEKNKRADKVTDAEVMQGFEDMDRVAGELAKLDETQITALRDFFRYGTAYQRTEGAGERREERQNLLQQLGRMPQTPSVSTGGLTPQAR